MKTLWNALVSPRLAIILSLLIVADVVVGTFTLSRYADFFAAAERELFFRWLVKTGPASLAATWWIYLLLALVALLALATVACVADSLAGLAARRRSRRFVARRLLTQAVHLGFVIMAIGHLVTSSAGSRSGGNRLLEGQAIAMPGGQGLSLRLDQVDVALAGNGSMERMEAALSLISGGQVIRQQLTRLNRPLLYQGNAVYIEHAGEVPNGLRFRVQGNGATETIRVMFTGPAEAEFGGYRIAAGRFLPDFARDGDGRPTSASREMRNPALEMIVTGGEGEPARGWALLNEPDTPVLAFDGYRLFLDGLEFSGFAVLSINRDPGAPIALVGALLFLGALIALLFTRHEGAELVSGPGAAA